MGAGTSPADPAPAGRAADGPDAAAEGGAVKPDSGPTAPARAEADSGSTEPARAETDGGSTEPARAETDGGSTEPGTAEPDGKAPAPRRTRRFPLFTRDTARPEGGGRAASGDAPAPARQWPLLTVLCAAGAGLLIVALDPFAEAFRIGTILIGAALIAGAVLRWVVPSVGMLAVRSRFTDLVTYGLMGTLIVLLALVAQPRPWLDVPILENAVRFTIR
ncbi:DUF3017 domain-containing protein [Streptomyces arboris]|uniref:DUF3017 domain-containing protein n=1 Tax=Streptomyces arboris TaxID=2600619 RepID=A0A5N5ECV8_9ACTN|nr:DUF3017 domain-containing protein [Streptomyces arboris]KAB2587773.1 DUF3017 domain-containing protein [Streptomyces arboris]